MSDVIYQECSTSAGWLTVKVASSSDGAAHYEVNIPPWDRDEQEGAVCSCDGFRYRGTCRHIREAYNEICHWSSLDGEKQTRQQELRRICPACGEPTRIVVVHTPTTEA